MEIEMPSDIKQELPFVCYINPLIVDDVTSIFPIVDINKPLVRNWLNLSLGFSLLELMVVVTILAVLAGIGIPAFRQLVESNRITVTTNDLLADMNLARTEAIKRKGIGGLTGQVVLCVSSNDIDCTGAPDSWERGWILFWDQNGSGTFATADNDIMLKTHGASPPNMKMTTSPADTRVITYDPLGAARGGLTKVTITNSQTNQSRTLCLNTLGQVSIRAC